MDIQALPPSVALDKNLADLQSRLSDSYPTASTDFLALSNPRCVFKTGTAWPVRTGPQAQRLLREALPVCDHPMQDRWLEIGQLISEHLDSCGVGVVSCLRCCQGGSRGLQGYFGSRGVPDVEIAFRDFLPFSPSIDPVAELRSPFTATLGIQIALLETPSCEGTGAVYLRESSQSDRVFLLTAAHVARPPPAHPNRLILCKQQSQTSQEIVVLGTSAYTNAINHMTDTIDRELLSIQTWEDEIKRWGPVVEGEPRDKTHAREDFKNLVKKSRRRIEATNELHDEVVTEHWTTPNQRQLDANSERCLIVVKNGRQQAPPSVALSGMESFVRMHVDNGSKETSIEVAVYPYSN
ncbi:hypothetical protein CPB85DRAFT_1330186 [Mucidula mucida]|nr:hypothetical protein CPB85DRAFT_1330186 [Mucidula mucida]